MSKYIRIPLDDNFSTLCPHCKKINNHKTGEVCVHVYKVTVKHIAFYYIDPEEKKTAKSEPINITKEKCLTVCKVCDEVYNKIGLKQELINAKVCSENCLNKKVK
jgi:hypothetical protein